jgi:hypothetical protein
MAPVRVRVVLVPRRKFEEGSRADTAARFALQNPQNVRVLYAELDRATATFGDAARAVAERLSSRSTEEPNALRKPFPPWLEIDAERNVPDVFFGGSTLEVAWPLEDVAEEGKEPEQKAKKPAAVVAGSASPSASASASASAQKPVVVVAQKGAGFDSKFLSDLPEPRPGHRDLRGASGAELASLLDLLDVPSAKVEAMSRRQRAVDLIEACGDDWTARMLGVAGEEPESDDGGMADGKAEEDGLSPRPVDIKPAPTRGILKRGPSLKKKHSARFQGAFVFGEDESYESADDAEKRYAGAMFALPRPPFFLCLPVFAHTFHFVLSLSKRQLERSASESELNDESDSDDDLDDPLDVDALLDDFLSDSDSDDDDDDDDSDE